MWLVTLDSLWLLNNTSDECEGCDIRESCVVSIPEMSLGEGA